MAGKNIVTRKYRAVCDKSNETWKEKGNYLNVPEDHGIIYSDDQYPFMNANDHEAGEGGNVVHFGKCISPKNPQNQISSAITGGIQNSLLGGAGLILNLCGINLWDKFTEAIGCDGCKCEPVTFVPWEFCDENNIIEGAPALTIGSKLACQYGGIITIVADSNPLKDAASSNETEEKDEKNDKNSEQSLSVQEEKVQTQNNLNSVQNNMKEHFEDTKSESDS